MERISNKTITDFFAEKASGDVKTSFEGVFSCNCVIRFISFHNMMMESGACYSFIIMSMDRSNKNGTHWWSFLDLHPEKEIFLFNLSI